MVRLPARFRGRIERRYMRDGMRLAGVDEVGRGCLAGPVYAACAVLDYSLLAKLPRATRALIRDSKQLVPEQRASVVPDIERICLAQRVASATVEEIERLGIVQATFLAMRRAIRGCAVPFDVLLVDGKFPLSGYDGKQETVIKGDSLCFAIAAASILAKESRDAMMRAAAREYPGYGFESHVGYGTRRHLDKIREKGICKLHRRNFAPIRDHDPIHATTQVELFESC